MKCRLSIRDNVTIRKIRSRYTRRRIFPFLFARLIVSSFAFFSISFGASGPHLSYESARSFRSAFARPRGIQSVVITLCYAKRSDENLSEKVQNHSNRLFLIASALSTRDAQSRWARSHIRPWNVCNFAFLKHRRLTTWISSASWNFYLAANRLNLNAESCARRNHDRPCCFSNGFPPPGE